MKLTDDIDGVTVTVGTEDHPFCGVFKGMSHTLTVIITDVDNQGTAPFRYVSDATIEFMKVSGTVSGNMHCAGLVGFAKAGTNLIRNCEVAVCVNSSGSHCGGILGHGKSSNTTITNSLFSGSIIGATSATGVIYGWGDEGTHTIVNCLSAGTCTSSGIELIHSGNTQTITNCYRKTIGGTQGEDASEMTNDELVAALGGGWQIINDQVVPVMDPMNIVSATLSGIETSYTSPNAPVSISYTVKAYDGTGLEEGVHYTAIIKNSKGETVTSDITTTDYYTLTLTGISPYTGVLTKRFLVLTTLQTEENDIYLINNALDWEAFVAAVNSGESYSGKKVKLMTDISTSTSVGGFFNGAFNGGGHTLTVNYSEGDCSAVFHLINGAIIQNLKVEGTISSYGQYPATFAGKVFGNSVITNCWSSADIESSEYGVLYAGAIASYVDENATLSIKDCAFTGTVTYSRPAGNAGGSMVGRVFGSEISTSLENCLFSPSALAIGGWQQYSYMFVSGNVRGNVSNCYYNDVAASSVLQKEGTDASGMTNEALASALGANWEVSGGQVVPKMDGVTIHSVAEWDAFAAQVNNGTDSYSGKTVILLADIGSSEHPVTTMAGTSGHPFKGTFEGLNHTIYAGINSSAAGAAPFRYVSGATIQNLNVAGTVTGGDYAGGLIGICQGENVITNCLVSADVSGTGYAGGLVGHGGNSSLAINNSIYSGTISSVAGHAGGLMGWCDALTLNIFNCMMKGTFSGTGKYHPIACKNGESTVNATITDTYYPNSLSITETGTNLLPGEVGCPVSTDQDDEWNMPVRAIDGNVYYKKNNPVKAVPYTYGFEFSTDELLLEGWKMVDCHEKTKPYEYGHHYGTGCFCIYYTDHSQYLISPELSTNSALLVSFYHHAQLKGIYKFKIGYSTTTNDISAFTWDNGETFNNEIFDNKLWELFEGNVPKGTKYVAIQFVPGYNYWYLDDFSVTPYEVTFPADLSVYVTENTATLTWKDIYTDIPVTGYAYQIRKQGSKEWSEDVMIDGYPHTISRLHAYTSYELRLKTLYEGSRESKYVYTSFTTLPLTFVATDVTEEAATLTWIPNAADDAITGYTYQSRKQGETWSEELATTSTSVTLEGLTADTDYDIRVKIHYGDDETDYMTFSFTSAMPIPYECDFENGMNRWSMVDCNTNGSAGVDDYRYTGIRSRAAHEGNLGFRFVRIDTNDDKPQYLISPCFAGDEAVALSFYYNVPLSYDTEIFQVGYSTTISDISAFEWVDEITAKGGDEWKYYINNVPAGTKYVAIKFTPSATWLYLDDFRFIVNYPPGSLTVSDVTATSAKAKWSSPETSQTITGYGVQQRLANNEWSAEITYPSTVTNEKIVLKNLTPNITYWVRVRALYEDGLSSSYVTTSFKTGCLIESIPYTQDFEDPVVTANDNELGELPFGWKGAATRVLSADGTGNFASSGQVLYFKGDGTHYVAVPDLPIALNKLQISFKWGIDSYNTNGTLTLCYITDELNSFLPIKSYTLTSSTEEKTMMQAGPFALDDLPDNAKQLVFKYTSSSPNGCLVDDVVVELLSVILADDDDNSSVIDEYSNLQRSVQLKNRTLYRNGDWNTLCLPFNMTDADDADGISFTDTPLEGATVKTLNSSAFSNGTLTLNFEDATSIEAGKPYIVKWNDGLNLTINSTDDWNAFAEKVNGGKSYAGKTVLLGADINVSTMVGTEEHPFSGTFEGAGHTLNVSISGGGDGAAPFRYISGATIRNVKTTGSVSGGNHSAGLAGIALGGTNSIRDCYVTASVSSSNYAGGILGNGTTSTTTISNCMFSGYLSAANMGIFCGWGEDGSTQTAENCVTYGSYADLSVIIDGGEGRSIDLLLGNGTKTVTNCYKNKDVGSQGDYWVIMHMGGTHPLLSNYLGGQWTYENGQFILNPTVNLIDTNIENPVFVDMTVSNAVAKVETDYADFIGTYVPLSFTADDKSILFLGTNSTLYYPMSGAYIGAQRAYFELKGIESGDLPDQARTIVLNFGDEDPLTGIEELEELKNGKIEDLKSTDAWYGMDGRKLNRMPTRKGIYINHGRKVVIK